MNGRQRHIICLLVAVGIMPVIAAGPASAQQASTVRSAQAAESALPPLPKLPADWGPAEEPGEIALTLKVLLGLAILSLAPALLMMVTSFTRIIIILGFLRSALGTQQTPPNSVLVGLALFLTLFVMYPICEQINREAVEPFSAGTLAYQEALDIGSHPLRRFMLKQTRDRDLLLFLRLAGLEEKPPKEAVPFRVLIPSFVISELKTAFQVGFVLYIPFLVIDIVVASSLMSMGMLMVPPVMISLPFKILLFVLVDGWHLIAKSIVVSFG